MDKKFYYLLLLIAFLVVAAGSISFAELQRLKSQCALGGKIYRGFINKYMVFVYGFTIMFAFYIACGYYQLHFYTEAVINYR